MTICETCNQEMLTANGCTELTVNVNNKERARLAYGKGERDTDIDLPVRCHDCGAIYGCLHHPMCDMEECPDCHGQLISCDCIVQGEEEDGPDPADMYGQ